MTLHARLIAKWDECKFGVKSRVNLDEDENVPSRQTAKNIRKNPDHSDTHGINALIESIDKHSQAVTDEVVEMNTKIQSI